MLQFELEIVLCMQRLKFTNMCGITHSHHTFSPYILIIHSHHTFSPYILIIHSHHTFSPYILIIHSHHTFSSYILTIHFHHTFSPYILIIHSHHTFSETYLCRKLEFCCHLPQWSLQLKRVRIKVSTPSTIISLLSSSIPGEHDSSSLGNWNQCSTRNLYGDWKIICHSLVSHSKIFHYHLPYLEF